MERLKRRIRGVEKSDALIHICDDFAVEILYLLPAESLIRFKSVCQSWNRLISEVCIPKLSTFPRGCFYHLQTINNGEFVSQLKYASLYNHCPSADERVIESLSALLPFKFVYRDLLHCCNGLLLFYERSQYYVCNPLTKQLIQIPKNAADTSHYMRWGAALAFDPRESLHYRVVCFERIYYDDRTVNIYIFSSKTGKWVCHRMSVAAPVYVEKRCAVYLQGVLYQLSPARYLIQFDLNQLNACAIKLPSIDKPGSNGLIGVSKDCLYFTNSHLSKGCMESKIFLWFLEDRTSWMLKYSIFIDDIHRHNVFHSHAMIREPLAIDVDAEALLFGCWDGILRYEVGNRTRKVVRRRLIFAQRGYFFTYIPCVLILKDFPVALQVN